MNYPLNESIFTRLRAWKSIVALLAGVLLIFLFLHGAIRHALRVNTDMGKTDQGQYINVTLAFEREGRAFVFLRNQMPLYPVLQAWALPEGVDKEEVFLLGKMLNVLLALGVVAGVGIVFWRTFHPWFGAAMAAWAAFAMIGFKAGYFQCEVLFYGLSLLFFASAFAFFTKPTWATSVLTGLLGITAYLTKASMLLGMYIFLASGGLIFAWRTATSLRSGGDRRERIRTAALDLLKVFVAFAVFFAVGSPYFFTSKERYGHYFYNVNTHYHLWYDSVAQLKEWTRQGQEASLETFLRDHTPAEMAAQFGRGLALCVKSLFGHYWVGYGAVLLFGCAPGLWLARSGADRRQTLLRLMSPAHFFALCFLAGYICVLSFFSAMWPQPRFFLTLALPALFWASCVAREVIGPGATGTTPRDGVETHGWTILSVFLFAATAAVIACKWAPRIGVKYFGF